jgi:aarF domain-containing kinase
MKSSIGSRSLKLLGLAAKLGREELAQKMREQIHRGIDEVSSGRVKARIEQAKLIATSLSQLKGAAMKAGQLLSLDAADYFPAEAVEILSKLQGKADPVDFATMHEVLLSELGLERVAQYEDLSPVPAASASIGQVHRARLNGQNVAIKIQYPGIGDSIDSDLKILKTLAQSMLSLSGRKIDVTELFDELAIVLKQEADYKLERAHMIEYAALLKPYPDFNVPVPIDSHCSERVLTMSWQPGLSIAEWLKTAPSMAAREQVAKQVLDLYCKEFFEWGLVQTDPNYANFLIEPNPLRLTVLDFGATLRYEPAFRLQYIEMLKAAGSMDRGKIIRSFIEFGLLNDQESDESKELFAEFLIMSLEPFQPGGQPFRFRDDDYAKRSRALGQKFTQSLKYSPPPRKILFLHRKLGGIFTLLKKLDVQMNIYPYWEQMVGTKIQT